MIHELPRGLHCRSLSIAVESRAPGWTLFEQFLCNRVKADSTTTVWVFCQGLFRKGYRLAGHIQVCSPADAARCRDALCASELLACLVPANDSELQQLLHSYHDDDLTGTVSGTDDEAVFPAPIADWPRELRPGTGELVLFVLHDGSDILLLD